MEKINIAELLRNCPKGMELDCTMFDEVKLVGVDEICITRFPIRVRRVDGYNMTLTKYGQYADADFGKCVIFPKGKTTWEGFVPPCKFKDGDIIYVKSKKCGVGFISIYKNESSSLFYDHCSVSLDTGTFYLDNAQGLIHKNDISISRLATKEEKEKLFKAIKDNGYRWNPKTKNLEKLVKPNFKVGDRVKHKEGYFPGVVTKINDEFYCIKYDDIDFVFFVDIICQDDWELVSDKFNSNSLKPFESRVLVRNGNATPWIGGFYSHFDKNSYSPFYCTGNVHGFRQCIPFKGNEHLLGTTNDCSKYYKTWE